MWIVYVVVFGLILAFGLFGADQYLCLKDVEKDLKLYLGDWEVAEDAAPEEVKVHHKAYTTSLKTLIKKHFKL